MHRYCQNIVAQHRSSGTGIREVDQFSDAITQLSRDVLTSSTKFLRIMDMASIELGGYEIRFDTGTVFVTDNFFPMLGLSQPDTSSLTPDTFRALLKNFGQCCPCTITPSGDEVYKVTPADGQVHYLRLKTTHEVLAQVGLVEDVTASTLERLRIEHDRDYDTLTGLYNRQAFQRECEALFLHPENLRHAAFLILTLTISSIRMTPTDMITAISTSVRPDFVLPDTHLKAHFAPAFPVMNSTYFFTAMTARMKSVLLLNSFGTSFPKK